MARCNPPVIPDQLLDQLLSGANAKTAFDKVGLLDELKKASLMRLGASIRHRGGQTLWMVLLVYRRPGFRRQDCADFRPLLLPQC